MSLLSWDLWRLLTKSLIRNISKTLTTDFNPEAIMLCIWAPDLHPQAQLQTLCNVVVSSNHMNNLCNTDVKVNTMLAPNFINAQQVSIQEAWFIDRHICKYPRVSGVWSNQQLCESPDRHSRQDSVQQLTSVQELLPVLVRWSYCPCISLPRAGNVELCGELKGSFLLSQYAH